MFFSLGYTVLMPWFCKESFSFHQFPRIQVHSANGTSLDSHNNLYSFGAWALKHVLFVGIHSFDDLVLQGKLLFPPFFLKSKFVHHMGQTWIHIITFILFVIGHYTYVLFIGIHGFDALVLEDKLLFPPFSLESKFIHQTGQT